MTSAVDPHPLPLPARPRSFWVLLGAASAALVIAFYPGLEQLVHTWNTVEEYSYGWFIPPLVAFLIWQRSDQLREAAKRPSWAGVALIVLAALMCIAGRLSLVRLLMQYGFVIGMWGVAWSALGSAGLRAIRVPLLIPLFMIPLPHFVLQQVSEQLQLISSQLGVWFIRSCDISVFLEGNVIDLGSMKLQVVDACSGLRYLFPLLCLGFVAGYFFQASFWKRALLVASTIPLTIIINSLRIGLIGVTVEYWGPAMAEGLLHEFEGWFMFMVCLVLMLGEMALLVRIGNRGERSKSLRDAFGMDLPRSGRATISGGPPVPQMPLQVVSGLLVAFALVTLAVPMRAEIVPARETFAQFPTTLDGGWTARMGRLDDDTLATLQLDDYLYADYFDALGHTINYYIAYYATQSGAEKASHSPRTCIPGGGWTISDSSIVTVEVTPQQTLQANRVVIERNGQRQLVYYWFKQGPLNVADDLKIKWYIVRDAIMSGRTDGALIRIVAPIPPAGSVDEVDRRIVGFMRTTEPLLPRFVAD